MAVLFAHVYQMGFGAWEQIIRSRPFDDCLTAFRIAFPVKGGMVICRGFIMDNKGIINDRSSGRQ